MYIEQWQLVCWLGDFTKSRSGVILKNRQLGDDHMLKRQLNIISHIGTATQWGAGVPSYYQDNTDIIIVQLHSTLWTSSLPGPNCIQGIPWGPFDIQVWGQDHIYQLHPNPVPRELSARVFYAAQQTRNRTWLFSFSLQNTLRAFTYRLTIKKKSSRHLFYLSTAEKKEWKITTSS